MWTNMQFNNYGNLFFKFKYKKTIIDNNILKMLIFISKLNLTIKHYFIIIN